MVQAAFEVFTSATVRWMVPAAPSDATTRACNCDVWQRVPVDGTVVDEDVVSRDVVVDDGATVSVVVVVSGSWEVVTEVADGLEEDPHAPAANTSINAPTAVPVLTCHASYRRDMRRPIPDRQA